MSCEAIFRSYFQIWETEYLYMKLQLECKHDLAWVEINFRKNKPSSFRCRDGDVIADLFNSYVWTLPFRELFQGQKHNK